MQLNNIDIRVLIKGRPIKEYLHNGDIFVEGREGSEFEIEISNRNYFNVESVISVDGLSIIDGKPAGPESTGYFVPANSTQVIPGWMIDQDRVAAFVFSGKGQSYSTQMSGSSVNNGVIGAMVFAEGHNRAKPVQPSRQRQPLPRAFPDHQLFGSVMRSGAPTGGIARGVGLNQVAYATASASSASSATTMACSTGAFTSDTMSWSDQERGAPQRKGLIPTTLENTSVQNLGTGFGRENDFRTQETAFIRGDMVAMLVCYYDNRQGLQARGIDLGGRRKPTPQAFPGMQTGCTPPPGWRG